MRVTALQYGFCSVKSWWVVLLTQGCFLGSARLSHRQIHEDTFTSGIWLFKNISKHVPCRQHTDWKDSLSPSMSTTFIQSSDICREPALFQALCTQEWLLPSWALSPFGRQTHTGDQTLQTETLGTGDCKEDTNMLKLLKSSTKYSLSSLYVAGSEIRKISTYV